MSRLLLVALAVVLALFSVQTVRNAAARDKELTFDDRGLVQRQDPLLVGVGVHFGIGGEYNYQLEQSAALIDRLGFASFRDDLPWSSFELPGRDPSLLEPQKLFDFLKRSKAQPLLILGHPNPAIPGGNPPLTPQGQQAFARFAVRAAAATAAHRPIYEIWNEWNMNAASRDSWLIGPGTPDDPRAAMHYASLARQTVPALRKAAPEAKIFVGAVGVDQDWSWTKAIVDRGAVSPASTLSVHMYNHCERDESKRSATEMIDRLGTLQTVLAGKQNAPPRPIYITEFGWPTATRPCVISRQAQADNIAQFLLWAAATPWLKGAWVYQLKDQGPDKGDLEANFGLVDYNYAPKPAACAVAKVNELIKGAKSFRIERPYDDVFLLQIAGARGLRIVAWRTRDGKGTFIGLPKGIAARPWRLCHPAPEASEGRLPIGAEPLVLDLPDSRGVTLTVSGG